MLKYVSDLTEGQTLRTSDESGDKYEIFVDGFEFPKSEDNPDGLTHLSDGWVRVCAFRIDDGADATFEIDQDEEVEVVTS